MQHGMTYNLARLAQDEGKATALGVAEEWHGALEAMAEVASEEQRKHINALIGVVAFSMYFIGKMTSAR